MDWRLTSLIKGPSNNGSWHSNIVGTLQTTTENNSNPLSNEYVYKISRLPSWRGYWEYFISHEIKTRIPSVKNFSRVVDVTQLLMDVDDDGRTLPSTKTKRQKLRNVVIQKMVLGLPLSKHIKFGCTEEFAFSIIFQVLCALSTSQKELSFTHYDLHCSNIILQKERYNDTKQIFYLYDFYDNPVLVPSYGYRAKIVDYEYSHIDSIKGKRFDSRLDLIGRGYIPLRFDSSYDVIHMVLACISYMIDNLKIPYHQDILSDLLDALNDHNSPIKFGEDGLLQDTGDPVYTLVLKSWYDKIPNVTMGKECSTRNPEVRKRILESQDPTFSLIASRYYLIIGLLFHNVRLPFKKIDGLGDEKHQIELVNAFFSSLSEYSPDSIDSCCVALYEYIGGDKDVFRKMGEFWNSKLPFLLQAATDALQTLYHKHIRAWKNTRMEQQKKRKFTPIKMLEYLQTKVDLSTDVLSGAMIHWMTRENRTKIIVRLTREQEHSLNTDYDCFRRGELIKQFL